MDTISITNAITSGSLTAWHQLMESIVISVEMDTSYLKVSVSGSSNQMIEIVILGLQMDPDASPVI